MNRNQLLAAMLVLVGTSTAVGVTYALYTPQPATRSMTELKDAGIKDSSQTVVVVRHERFGNDSTKRRINRNQPGLLRPRQSYGNVARVALCWGDEYLDGGYGNCVRTDGGTWGPFITEKWQHRYTQPDGGRLWYSDEEQPREVLDDGGLGGLLAGPDLRNDGGTFDRIGNYPRTAELVIPSLRADLVGFVDDSGVDDAGEDTSIDDATTLADDTVMLHCQQVDDLVAAGSFVNPYATRFCGALNRLALQPSPCMIPNGWREDGGWCEEECGIVNCKGIGPYGSADGGARWRGFNVTPRDYATGPDCVPVECGVQAGDVPSEWL